MGATRLSTLIRRKIAIHKQMVDTLEALLREAEGEKREAVKLLHWSKRPGNERKAEAWKRKMRRKGEGT